MSGLPPTPPKPCAGNPGISVKGKTAFVRDDKQWTEEYNTIATAASVLEEAGYRIQREGSWLVHPASGFLLLPQLVSLQPFDDGGVSTTTTIQVNHPVLAPDGIFEYQHSTGDDTAESIRKGFEQWAQVDFVPLLESLEPEPRVCTTLKMSLPASDGVPARVRRAVLGPVMHFMQTLPAQSVANAGAHRGSQQAAESEEHPFCPCCLVTNSFETFRELFAGEGFYGVRLLAVRTSDGTPQADCRVNGEDWEEGTEALRKYAETWPPAGYELRKQYVVFQTIEQES